MDFSKQIKLEEEGVISQQLKDLSKKSYIVATGLNEIGTFKEFKGKRAKFNVVKRGCVIR